MLCLREAKEGGESLLVSTITIYNEMMARRPDLAALLFEPVATDRRGEVPPGELPYFLVRAELARRRTYWNLSASVH